MRIIIVAIVCLTSQLMFLTPAFANEAVRKILFTNVHVFNGIDEERLMNANVLVDGKLIEAISTKNLAAENAIVLDGKGRTLMPGLIDMHWHSAYASIPMQLGLIRTMHTICS